LSKSAYAQFDFSQIIDRSGSNSLYAYYQYQDRGINREEYVRIKKQAPKLSEDWIGNLGVTSYVKYSFINREDFSISIGTPIRFNLDFKLNAAVMLDLNFGMHTQPMSTYHSDLKRHGFYIGAGFGFATTEPVVSLEQVNYSDLPFDVRDNILVVDKEMQVFPYQPIFQSFGLNFHSAYSFNYYSESMLTNNRGLWVLPTGIRVQGHLATDNGPSFISVGLVFNYRVFGTTY
jgi:hypothetical protein